MRMYDLIQKKRDGGILTEEEIKWFISSYVKGEIPDYQVAALCMAIYFRGMNLEETTALTFAVRDSGDRLDFSEIHGLRVDKHSTGGVGDKTSLVVAPIVASLGVKVAKMSGRGLGHTGGTIDKLEAIPGFKTDIPVEEFKQIVNSIGIAIVGQNAELAPADKWIIAKLQNCIREVTTNLNKYEMGVASDLVTDFVWDNFCDWYIELCKPALYGEDENRKTDVLAVLCFVLENALKLLHPFIPFVTEEIYANLPNTNGSIMVAEFPRYNAKMAYKKEAKAFEGVMEIIKAVRAMKKDADCPPSKKVELNVVTESKRLLQVNKDCIIKLSGASALNFVDSAASVEGKTVSTVTEIAQIYVPLGELVDIEKEKARLMAEIERIDGEIARAEGKLNNESFVSKAPAKLVDAEREKVKKYQDMKAKCVAQLESL